MGANEDPASLHAHPSPSPSPSPPVASQEPITDSIVLDSITRPPTQEPDHDAPPIDIRIDDHLKPVALPDEPPAYPTQAHSATSVSRFLPRPERKMTPMGTYQLLLPGALFTSGILFNPQCSLLDVQIEQDAAPSPPLPARPATTTTTATTAASPTTPAPESISLQQHPDQQSNKDQVEAAEPPPSIPSAQTFSAAKPHPNATFVPETLEWRIIVPQESIFKNPIQDDQIITATEIYDACSLPDRSVSVYETVPTTILPVEQLLPVTTMDPFKKGVQQTESVVDEFNVHKCWITGRRIVSSPPDAITTVVDRSSLIAYKEDRMGSPAPGCTPLETFVRSLRVLLRVLGNALHGEARNITTSSVTITQKLGWDAKARQIFEQLGWTEDLLPDGRQTIKPPATLLDGPENNFVQRRMIRAWIELQVWLEFYTAELAKQVPRSSMLDQGGPAHQTTVKTKNATDDVRELIGYHSVQDDFTWRNDPPARTQEALYFLGASASNRDELIKFSYLLHVEASPARSGELLSHVEEIYITQRSTSRILQELIAYEKSKGRYTARDVDKAYQRLLLSREYLGEDVARETLPHEFIVDNFRARAREALAKGDSPDYLSAREALRTISMTLGNPPMLQDACNNRVGMETEQAYALLEVTRDMDDSTLLVVYEIRLGDNPAHKGMLEEALSAVAEERRSDFLRNFLITGERSNANDDANGWQQMPSEDRPTGINNIGNTCYLNSVLQYFFTIREIRDRVLQLAATNVHPEAQKLEAAADAASRRVGGRKVSRREVERSRKFVLHLAELFRQLIHTPDLAVTPERELAYLALVSSSLEGDDMEQDTTADAGEEPAGTRSEEPTIFSDEPATISPVEEKKEVSEAPALEAVPEDEPMDTSEAQPVATMSPEEATELATDVSPTRSLVPASQPVSDSAESTQTCTGKDEAPPPLPMRSATISSTAPPPLPVRSATIATAGPDSENQVGAPPLPPRPRRQSTTRAPGVFAAPTTSGPAPARRNSLMQLGAQQDVSECLDNCMFQLEIALALQEDENAMDIDDTPTPDSARANSDLLPRLFLGKTSQQLELANADSDSARGKGPSIHTKEEIFKILPVDVVEDGRDLFDGLDGFFDEETLVGSGGQPVRRTVTLVDPPPLLQIQLQRVQYDRVTARAFKSQAHVELAETLHMDRYLDFEGTDSVRLEKRRVTRKARRRIEEARSRLSALRGVGTTLSATAARVDSLGEELDVSAGLSDALRAESEAVSREVTALETEVARLKASTHALWADETRVEYRLAAVFMHRGEASHGHYFVNQRKLPLTPGCEAWFKYNDSAVTPVSVSEVLRDTSGATPYLVTYVRSDIQDARLLVDTVCRSIEPEAEAEPRTKKARTTPEGEEG